MIKRTALVSAVAVMIIAAAAGLPSVISTGRLEAAQALAAATSSVVRVPKATDFELTSTKGKRVRLSNVIKANKVTILNFFATWCPPCNAEMPDFVKFYKKYHNKGVEMLFVDLQESLSTVKSFISKYKITSPVLLDVDGDVADDYSVFSIPTTLVIDANGVIKKTFIGSTSAAALAKEVDALL